MRKRACPQGQALALPVARYSHGSVGGQCHQGFHHPTSEQWSISRHAVALERIRNLPFGRDERLTITDIVGLPGEQAFDADLDGGSAFEGGEFELVGAAAVSPEFSLFAEIEFKVEQEEVEVEEFWGQWRSKTKEECQPESSSLDSAI